MENISAHPLYRRHDLDSVMSSLWGFYKNNFLVLFIASFVMSLGIQYMSLTFNFSELQSITDPAEMLQKIYSFIWPIVIISLINLLFNIILNYYIIYNPVDRSQTIFISCLKAFKYFVPYLIIMILLAFIGSLGLLFGILLLIVGVFFAIIYLMNIYLFILPVMLVEGTNVGHVISRSLKLAHSGFWRNMGWVAVFLLILIVISVITSAIVLLPFTGSFIKILANPQDAAGALDYMTNPLFLALSALVNALYMPLMPVFATILYFNGRANEEHVAESVMNSEPPRVSVDDLYAKPRNENQD